MQAILLLIASFCSAQSYYFQHYQADDGLAHNTVNTIMQDSRGMMWVGTRGGLNRFDGYTFKTFANDANKPGTLVNNNIECIKEDLHGMIWIGTGRGMLKYDPYQEIFKEITVTPAGGINHILVDQKNNLWFLNNRRLQFYDQQKNKITDIGLNASCQAFDKKSNIWLGDNDGSIKVFDPQKKTIKVIQIIDRHIPYNLRLISKIFPTAGDEILIGTTKQGLKSYNIKTGQIKSLLLRNKDNTEIYVRDIISNGKNEYWIATESGIYIYNTLSGSSINLKKRAGDQYSITDNAVYSLCRDSRGGLWAGTFFGGINYFSKENARFEKYYPLLGANSISGNAVREICGDNKNNIWIGTEDAGINKFNQKSAKFINYTSDGRPTSISYPNIHGLLAVGNKLYIGPFQHGLEIMDINTGKITDRFKLFGENGDNTSDFVMSIYLTRDSTLLIGTTGTGTGLFQYIPKSKQFKTVRGIPENTFVFAIIEDHEGTIWTGSQERGTFYFNPKTGKKGNLKFNSQRKGKNEPDYAVRGIFEDSNQCLWFTTEGGGLVKLGPDRKTIKKITIENGLPSNSLFRILEDDTKHLWISSLKGLICLDLKTDKFKVYTQSNGLLTDQFNYNSAFKGHDGKMYFGSVKGMIAFYPKDFGKPEISPPTFITGFHINSTEITPKVAGSPLVRSIMYTDTILLNYDQSNFSIEFSALTYSSPKVTRYKYIMKGLENDWTYLKQNRLAYFTDLSPGDYTFIVTAESNIGSWTGQPRKLFIRISPPFWKSYEAYFVYLCVLAIVIYLSIFYYNRYLENKNRNKLQLFEHEKEKEIYQAKIEFFTNIAHEIQTPLTLISGPVDLMIEKIDEVPAISKNLLMVQKNTQRLLDLTTQLLDFRKTEADQFGLSFVKTDISKMLKEQIAIFTPEAEKERISLRLELPENQVIAFVDSEAFVKICSNLIANAIKYAATTATVSIDQFTAINKLFTIKFSNDGRGIPDEFKDKIFEPFFRIRSDEKRGTGIGLSLAKSLTELHNGSLTLISGRPDAIMFALMLPVHQQFEFKLCNWKNIKQL
ncbi:two-component regulator propeller domain-containing protein [Mucilaginibacter sp.]|uniref:ligand-binding sensor domain-containing protein n=1 Tax=Mucilaginibacter sp. TaxID=1882438 RepID=UPI003566ED58